MSHTTSAGDRPDPIPCPVCGADIDPTIIDNEHIVFGTDPIKILVNIADWGCFAIPGWNHSFIEQPFLAELAKPIHAELKGDRLGIQHAWKLVRSQHPDVSFNHPYALVPQRLREGPASPLVRQPGRGEEEREPLGSHV